MSRQSLLFFLLLLLHILRFLGHVFLEFRFLPPRDHHHHHRQRRRRLMFLFLSSISEAPATTKTTQIKHDPTENQPDDGRGGHHPHSGGK